MRITYLHICLFIWMGSNSLLGQCSTYTDTQLSPKTAQYSISARLDNTTRTAHCQQTLTWRNDSPDTLSELRFYMYMNAFKNTQSAFITRSKNYVFDQWIYDKPAEEWGYIDITSINDSAGLPLLPNARYIQPTIGIETDQSILSVPLATPLLPGQSTTLDLDFVVKMPKIMARAGYSLADYYLFVHWFPQPCVYAPNADGIWAWNSHEFVPGTEFFADFGDYHVTLDLPADMVVGATGCSTAVQDNGQRKIHTFQAYDVIDFAWVIYPRFLSKKAKQGDTDITLLIPPEHEGLADRLITAAQQTLEYLGQNVAPYPYPSITVVDPPLHALRSGLMEYPMLITCGSAYGAPSNLRTIESLVVHELTHQYFMGILASNEKEEAWVDEGFVTYYEDRIMDHYYGEKAGLYDLMGYRSGNKENSRLEYSTMDIPQIGKVARPGWQYKEAYKGLIYAKTATTLQTLEGLIGRTAMDTLIQSYYQKFKFSHPSGQDFVDLAATYVQSLGRPVGSREVRRLFDQAIFDDKVCDYAVRSFSNGARRPGAGYFGDAGDMSYTPGSEAISTYFSEIYLVRIGEMQVPVDIEITLSNGEKHMRHWDGMSRTHVIEESFVAPVQSVYIDPDHKVFLDVDFTNNSKTLDVSRKPYVKYSSKAIQWVQNVLQVASALF